jgi:hypothetical protein
LMLQHPIPSPRPVEFVNMCLWCSHRKSKCPRNVDHMWIYKWFPCSSFLLSAEVFPPGRCTDSAWTCWNG